MSVRKPIGVVAVTVVISACVAAGCGGGSKSTPPAPGATSAGSASPNATTAAYRKALEGSVVTLSSDVSTFASCTISFSAPACRSWAVTDKGLVRRALKQLAATPVPAGDASDAAAVRRLLGRVSTWDVALIKAIDGESRNGPAVQAATANTKGAIEQLNPILNRLDPGLVINVPA